MRWLGAASTGRCSVVGSFMLSKSMTAACSLPARCPKPAASRRDHRHTFPSGGRLPKRQLKPLEWTVTIRPERRTVSPIVP
jgi:hypothetical protein